MFYTDQKCTVPQQYTPALAQRLDGGCQPHPGLLYPLLLGGDVLILHLHYDYYYYYYCYRYFYYYCYYYYYYYYY